MTDAVPDGARQKRRYRAFLAAEAVLLAVAVAGCAGAYKHSVGAWAIWPLTLLWTWHVVALPIAFLYLIGRPIVMSLSPLFPSAESRTFRQTLRDRPWLADAEFYARYFAGSGIPEDIVTRVRQSLARIDHLYERAVPSDLLYLLGDDLDFADVIAFVGKAFGVRLFKSDYDDFDGSLDNLVRQVHRRIS
jgi:hypothetical protein